MEQQLRRSVIKAALNALIQKAGLLCSRTTVFLINFFTSATDTFAVTIIARAANFSEVFSFTKREQLVFRSLCLTVMARALSGAGRALK